MAYDGWFRLGDTELANVARTARLAEVMGIDAVWTEYTDVSWIATALGETGYDAASAAPWYDPEVPASSEFAGIMPLSLSGLDDSTRETTTIEYITNGGSSGRPRNKTLPMVASVVVVASTSRGADFGKRWLDRQLAGNRSVWGLGRDLRYFQWEGGNGATPPIMHRRDVSTTRGTTVTRKSENDCSALWFATFTLTASDPFEYSEPYPRFANLGGAVTGLDVTASGSLPLTEQGCPQYDYTPLYDPLYPALVAPPVAPDFYPEGWFLETGTEMTRHWVRVPAVAPSSLLNVPIITLTTSAAARMIRISVWSGSEDETAQCGPLWQGIVTYLPPSLQFVIDGEREVAYAWDGTGFTVRRTDSLVFGPEASPLEWAGFNDPDGLLITLDIMDESGGAGTVRASLALVQKSD